jgi:hypothetical protein
MPDCIKYRQVKEAMNELQEAAVQERSSPVVPGQSPAFRSALKKLQDLGRSVEAFSNKAIGEIRRTIAMVDVMRLPPDPESPGREKFDGFLKENLPLSLMERKNAFETISTIDCPEL